MSVSGMKFCKYEDKRNDIDTRTLKQIIKQAKRKHFGILGKAEKFVNDLNAEIELGWTGSGQTNRLLGRITMRAYIFHHIFSGGEPLKGEALVDEIVEVARSLPGYSEWCQHQHEIEHRVEEWARCIENSHYFHFGEQSRKTSPEPQDPELTAAIDQAPSWNQRQSAATRDRIRRAIADLLEHSSLPARPTARFQSLLKYGIGGASLYRHRDLWHPNYFDMDSNLEMMSNSKSSVKNPPPPPNFKTDSQLDCVSSASNWHNPPSLLPTNGSDKPSSKALSDQTDSNPLATASNLADSSSSQPIQRAQQSVQQTLLDIKGAQDAAQEAARIARSQYQQIKSEAAQRRQIDRMQQYVDSSDPISVAEAMAWAQVNPGVLNLCQLQLPLLDNIQRLPLDHLQVANEEPSQSQVKEDRNGHLK